MADTWQKGNFGLSSISGVNRSFDELEQHFNDWLDGNYENVSIPLDVTTIDVPLPLDVTLINVDNTSTVFDNVSIPNAITYTNVPKPSVPNYEDMGVVT